MDVYCCKCAEPWDVSEIAEVKKEIKEKDPDTIKEGWKFSEFKILQCPSCCNREISATPNSSDKLSKTEAMSICADLLGDDIDGMASFMDDAEYLGLFED